MDAEEAAEAYDKVQTQYQAPDGVDMINRLCIKKGSLILDLGCGTGYLSSILAERVGTEGIVIGIDPKSERIEIAKSKYAHINNLEFIVGTSQDIPEGPYDLVVCVHVLHWVEDKMTVLKSVLENLKHEGTFAIICAEGDVTEDMLVLNPLIGKDPIFYWTSDQYETSVIDLGFSIESKSTDIIEYNFESVEKYIEWVLATMSVVAATLDPNVMSQIRRQCTEPRFAWKKLEYILKRKH